MKAFIFDFDGVIVDSETYWDKFSFNTYREIVPAFTLEDDRQLKGRSVHDIYPMMVEKFGLSMSKEEYMKHVYKLTDKIYGELCNALPGLTELIERLRANNLPIGIASSSQREWIVPTLKRLGYEGVFSPIVTAADVGVGKPNPAVFLETARLMHAEPAQCLVLEDSTNGVKAAKAAGMICIGLRHAEGYQQDLTQADVEVWGLDEINDQMLDGIGLRV